MGDRSCVKGKVGKRYEEKGPWEKGLGGFVEIKIVSIPL